jgi:hypothetical protein
MVAPLYKCKLMEEGGTEWRGREGERASKRGERERGREREGGERVLAIDNIFIAECDPTASITATTPSTLILLPTNRNN